VEPISCAQMLTQPVTGDHVIISIILIKNPRQGCTRAGFHSQKPF